MGYSRGLEPFFANDAWDEITRRFGHGLDNLLIYCGAGVTIDRTGLGWQAMVAKLFPRENSDHPEFPSIEQIHQLGSLVSPEALASIMYQYTKDKWGEESTTSQKTALRLADILYVDSGWQSGRLAANVAKLIYSAAKRGTRVSVITTNYETYIAEEFRKISKDQGKTVHGEADETVALNERNLDDALKPEVHDGKVQLTYLHGAVKRDGLLVGRLVITELDYAQTREAEVEFLTREFENYDTCLILGASLNDPPLVESLCKTAEKNDGYTSSRYCLIPIDSLGVADLDSDLAESVATQFRHRGHPLGVRILTPDFKFQIAQLVEEALYAMPLGEDALAAGKAPKKYSDRLEEWWGAWVDSQKLDSYLLQEGRPPQNPDTESAGSTDSQTGPDPDSDDGDLNAEVLTDIVDNWTDLLNILEELEGVIADNVHELDIAKLRRENFRLELWVRQDAADGRCLTLWNTSAGPILDRRLLNSKEIVLGSSNSSVRAFSEGRPQHHDLDELVTTSQGRWRSFVSVPINLGGITGQTIPVGVLTLASDQHKRESCLPLTTVGMNSLVEKMRLGGELLLRVTP